MKNEGKGKGAQFNASTQRNVATPTNNFELTSIKAFTHEKPLEITPERLRAVTRDGRDVFYTALTEVAIRRGMLIVKEAHA